MGEYSIPVIDVADICNQKIHTQLDSILSKESDINAENDVEHILDRFSQQIYNSLSKMGCVYLINHGIPQSKIRLAFHKSEEFFRLSNETKLQYKKPDLKLCYYGYHQSIETLANKRAIILREMFDICGENKTSDSVEQFVPGFKDALQDLKSECDKLGQLLLYLLAKALNLESPEYFINCHSGILKDLPEQTQTNFRTMSYPILQPEIQKELGGILCAEHTDYGTCTLLFQDELPGLEVKLANGDWIQAPIVENAILVNTGDLMEIWSAGRLPAIVHRVVASENQEGKPKARQSMPYFLNPDNETIVSPIVGPPEDKRHVKYLSVVAREYCQNRLGYHLIK